MATLTEAINRIEDPELRNEVNLLLRNLQMLAEGPSQSLEPSVSHGKTEGSAPKGTILDRPSESAPPDDRSLWDHYAFRFGLAALAKDEVELRRLLILASRAYEDTIKRPDEDRIEIERTRDEQRDIQLLLEHGEGIHAAILSARHRWPIGWVKIIRERNGKDPDYGRERPKWKALDSDGRYAICEHLQAEGMSQREAAFHLGVSKRSVQLYWARKAA